MHYVISTKMKNKITIITLHSIRNYGSVLQAFATQKKLSEFGFDIDFINFQRADTISIYKRLKTWIRKDSIPAKFIKIIVLTPSLIYQDIIFEKFIKNHLNIQARRYSKESDFNNMVIDADIYCTGSDQVWNSNWNLGLIRPMFLNFVPDSIPKIAYSASFGKVCLDEWEKDETRKLLERYSYISVRESSAVDIISKLGIKNVEHLLDPTLQMPCSFWKQYAGKDKSKHPYVLIYQLNSNPKFDKYAKEFAHQKGLKLIRFCLRFDQIIKEGKSAIIPDIFDFVSYIYHASYVITDSFHATAFSINLNTDFISIYPDEFSNRIESLLKLTGLQNRHLISYDDYSFVDQEPIDFTFVNQYLDNERRKGDEFLKKALNIIKK